MHFAGLVHHVIKGVWGPDLTLRPFCRFLLPTASRSPLFLLLLHYIYLPIAILGIRLLVLPLVEACVVVVVGGVVEIGVVVVAKVVVPLDLAPLAPIGTVGPVCFCRLLLLAGWLPLDETTGTQCDRAHCRIRCGK